MEELQERIDALPEESELEGEEIGDYLLEDVYKRQTQYTIAELTPSADYQFFRLHGSTTNGVSFYHQDATPIRLDCENRYPGWSILLKKADSKIVTTLLPGAVFALYSPLASDQIQEGDAAYDAYLALSESERPAMTFAEPGTSIGTEGIGCLLYTSRCV